MTSLVNNTRHRSSRGFGSALAALLVLSVVTVGTACSSNDDTALVLINAPFASYASPGNRAQVTITLDNNQVTQKTVNVADVLSGKVGIRLPSGSNGHATVAVVVTDASGCVIATGSSSLNEVVVKAGETSVPVTITLSPASQPCSVSDGGLDGGPPAPADAATDAVAVDGAGEDLAAHPDTGLPGVDGPPSAADTADARQTVVDAPMEDGAVTIDGGVDAASLGPDVAPDAPVSDLPAQYDLGSDGSGGDAPTTMNVLANCTAYTHSQKDSTGAIEDWGIRQLVFSADGKYLMSFGEDGRAKLWNVTPSGLAEPASGLVFSGYYNLSGTISQNGQYVAVGDSDSQVTLYDLPSSVALGVPTKKWSLAPDSFSPKPSQAARLQFTTDGAHLIVVYSADSRPDPNPFVVWDLGTQQIVRQVSYDYDDWPMAIFPGDYTGTMWVASAASITTDAGDYVSTVTLMDVAQASPSKAQVTMPGYINKMAFSPDGTTLAIAFDSGEVSLWDITNKANITRLGSPLIAGSTSGTVSAYSLAYAPDGKYLAAGTGDFFGSSSINLAILQQRLVLQKTIDYLPWSVAFAPDGLALAVGERDLGVLLYCRP